MSGCFLISTPKYQKIIIVCLFLFIFISILMFGRAFAHGGGTEQITLEKNGPYQITVWSESGSGDLHRPIGVGDRARSHPAPASSDRAQPGPAVARSPGAALLRHRRRSVLRSLRMKTRAEASLSPRGRRLPPAAGDVRSSPHAHSRNWQCAHVRSSLGRAVRWGRTSFIY